MEINANMSGRELVRVQQTTTAVSSYQIRLSCTLWNLQKKSINEIKKVKLYRWGQGPTQPSCTMGTGSFRE